MNDTTPDTKGRGATVSRRRGWTVLVLAVALSPLAATLACRPPGPKPDPGTTTTSRPPLPGKCRRIDFAKATVEQVPSTATSPRYRLTVTGTKPSISQSVSLVPVTYIQQPEYWLIEVVACDPPEAGLPATGPYTATLDLTGVLGTKGIEVYGATRSERIDVPATPTHPGLSGTAWVLDAPSLGVPVPSGRAITLNFSATTATGSAACNTYNASYTAVSGRLTFGPIATTRMACEPPVGAAESAYLRKLAAVTGYRVSGSQLTLTGAAGSLTFGSAPR